MSKIRTRWVSRRERDLWCVDFTGYGADHSGLCREIEAAEAVLRERPANSVLVAVDLNNTPITDDIAGFFARSAQHASIHKIAILGLSRRQRFWCTNVQRVPWPKAGKFFDDYETAKDWLVAERD